MIETTDAAPKVAQELVVKMFPAEFVGELNTAEPLGLEKVTEHVLEHVYLQAEAVKVLCRRFRAAVRALAIEQPAFRTFFDLWRRQVREREEVFAFKMSALIHELLAALIVDHAGHRVRECSGIRVSGCTGS